MKLIDAAAVLLIAAALVAYVVWAVGKARGGRPRWRPSVRTDRDGTIVVSVRAGGRHERVVARIGADVPEPECSERLFAAESDAEQLAAALNQADRR